MVSINKLSYLSPSPVVLAAGGGTRMGGAEKACLKVAGRSLLERHFDNFAAIGIPPSKVSVVCAHEAVRREAERLGGTPVESSFGLAPGTLGSFMSCFPASDCLVVHGDLLWEPAMVVAALESSAAAVVPVDPSSIDPEAMKAEVDSGRLVRLSKDIPPSDCHGESMGIFLFRRSVLPRLFACCGAAMRAKGSSASLDDAVTLLAESVDVAVVDVTGCLWDEVDTPEDLERAGKRFNV